MWTGTLVPRLSSWLLTVVCAGDWPHNLGFGLDDTSVEDVAMNIDGFATPHWAREALWKNAFEVYHHGFAKKNCC